MGELNELQTSGDCKGRETSDLRHDDLECTTGQSKEGKRTEHAQMERIPKLTGPLSQSSPSLPFSTSFPSTGETNLASTPGLKTPTDPLAFLTSTGWIQATAVVSVIPIWWVADAGEYVQGLLSLEEEKSEADFVAGSP